MKWMKQREIFMTAYIAKINGNKYFKIEGDKKSGFYLFILPKKKVCEFTPKGGQIAYCKYLNILKKIAVEIKNRRFK